MYIAGGFIDVLSRRATGFHKQTKLLELNFFIRKTFAMVKPAWQNCPHSQPLTKPLIASGNYTIVSMHGVFETLQRVITSAHKSGTGFPGINRSKPSHSHTVSVVMIS